MNKISQSQQPTAIPNKSIAHNFVVCTYGEEEAYDLITTI
jgi:hypothetical protein